MTGEHVRNPEATALDPRRFARRLIRVGWIGLALFAALGLALEAFHAVKAEWYLAEIRQVRRLMLTLAHAHGTLIAVLHIALGLVVAGPWADSPVPVLAARLLTASLVLMPAGFFLGGIFVVGGDPGVGVVLAALGGLFLVVALVSLAVRETGPAGSKREPCPPRDRKSGAPLPRGSSKRRRSRSR